MRGHVTVSSRHILAGTIGSSLSLAAMTGAAPVAAEPPSELPPCPQIAAVGDDGVVVDPWQALLDEEGAVTGYRLTLRHDGTDHQLRSGRRGFAVAAGPARLLFGERDREGTRLDMVDTRRACRLWSQRTEGHAFPEPDAVDGRVRLAIHDRDSRHYRVDRSFDVETGVIAGESEGLCLEGCYPSDGSLSLTALEPAGAAQPTPDFAAGGWGRDRTLGFRWGAGAVPPTWARSPLQAAAADAHSTSDAASPRFPYQSGADDTVAYTSALPAFCSDRAIACAGRSMPTDWGVWIRPHGTDFPWGTLRWCQKTSSSAGCFDIRRVMLHELGHIVGLDHPSNAGFTLSSSDSVMQGVTPARPSAGSSRHSFGRCDVATLQELYDTPDNKTSISTCNDVATTLGLATSRSSVGSGSSVTLTARLQVDDRTVYRQLASNPLNGRSVKLKFRPAASDGPWQTAWMRPLYSSGRYELSITPGATWEFKAVFPAPGDEGLRYSRSDIRKVKVHD